MPEVVHTGIDVHGGHLSPPDRVVELLLVSVCGNLVDFGIDRLGDRLQRLSRRQDSLVFDFRQVRLGDTRLPSKDFERPAMSGRFSSTEIIRDR